MALPNKTFWVNYNARNYNSTTLTIPKENGQLFNEDLVLPGSVTFTDDHITITGDKRIHFAFNNTSDNIFNRTTNTASITIIAKTSNGRNTWFVSNRSNVVGWMVSYSNKNQMAWTGDDNAYTSSTSPMILTWRCGNGTQQYIAHSDNVTGTPYQTTAWVGNETKDIYFFGGNISSENWTGDFYWLYISPETLTDAEIQQVITYNDHLHTFSIDKSNARFAASGGTETVEIEAETTWTASTPSFVSVSPSTGDTGTTQVTISCPSYSGETRREDVITFTDNDDYTLTFKARQNGNSAGFSNIYLGDNNLLSNTIYLGDNAVNTIYLGEEIIYSNGPFVGLKASPQTLDLNNANSTANITIRSSEDWTITDDSGGWLSYSTTTGTTGKTVVTVTAATTQAERTATITVTSANYTATIAVSETPHEIPYNEVWYKTRNNNSLAPDSGKYFFDSNENQLTYTESFDSESGLWKMVFNGNVYGNTAGLYRSGGGQLVEIWLPSTYVKANSMVTNSLMSFEKFKGESPTIVDGGNALVCLVGDLQNYVVDSAKKNVETITIPEGVVGLAWGCFYGSDLLTLNLPSTFSTVSGEYIFAQSKLTTLNCYAITCPSKTNFLWALFGGSGTLHYPAGSDYSNFTVPSNWTKVGDL